MVRKSPQDGTPASPSRRKFLRGLAVTTTIVAATSTYGYYIGGNDLEVVRTRIHVSDWPVGRRPLRVGYLSDFHCDTTDAIERSRRAVGLLMEEEVDVALLGGDYVTNFAGRWIKGMVAAISPVTGARFGAYGVLGNHDWWSNKPFQIAAALDAAGIGILMNSSVELSGFPGVWIVGLDSGTDKHDDVDLALRGVPTDAIKILIVHEPDLADKMPPGFALQISGHSHAGQVRIFGQPIDTPPLARRYKQGLMAANNHPVYVSRGVGMVQPAIRIDCPPEVSVLTLGP